MFTLCKFHLPRTHFFALSLLLLFLPPFRSFAQSIHDPSFELPLSLQPGSDVSWTVCNGMPDVQVMDGNGTGIYGVHTPALHGERYLGLLDTDFGSREAIGQAMEIESGVHHYGQVGLFRSMAHHSWNGTGQLQLWGGSDCSHLTELLWTSGSVTNVDVWQYYAIQFTARGNHDWLSLVVALDAGSGEMTYLCVDDLRLSNVFLAIEFVHFEAHPGTTGVELAWETASLTDAERFLVEWSADGQVFSTLGEVQGEAGESTFSYAHQPAQAGNQYYRITAVDLGGHTMLSEVRQAMWTNEILHVYPNPVNLQAQAGQIQVSIPTSTTLVSSMRLLDMQGRILAERIGSLSGIVNFTLPSHLASGCYELQVISGSTLQHKRLIVE